MVGATKDIKSYFLLGNAAVAMSRRICALWWIAHKEFPHIILLLFGSGSD
jgi:hypothetical protein